MLLSYVMIFRIIIISTIFVNLSSLVIYGQYTQE